MVSSGLLSLLSVCVPDRTLFFRDVFDYVLTFSETFRFVQVPFRTLPNRLVTSGTHNEPHEKILTYTRKNGFSHTIFHHFPSKTTHFSHQNLTFKTISPQTHTSRRTIICTSSKRKKILPTTSPNAHQKGDTKRTTPHTTSWKRP